jgi:hypothetical protein
MNAREAGAGASATARPAPTRPRTANEVFLKSVVLGTALALLGALVGGFVDRR